MFRLWLLCSTSGVTVVPMSNRPGPLAQRIAAEVRAELGRQNRSRRWLAEQIEQSHVTVSRWVNGDGGMTFDALDSICQALGLSVADLLAAADTRQAASRDTRRDVDALLAA